MTRKSTCFRAHTNLTGLVLALYASPLLAQTPPAGDAAGAPPAATTPAPSEGAPAEGTAAPAADAGSPDEVDLDQKIDPEDELSSDQPVAGSDDPAEAPSTQYAIGARYRLIVVPKFLINAFGIEGARDVIVNGAGLEFAMAKPNFEIMFATWYAGYGLQETPFKAPGDGQEAWELVTSDLHQAYITADLSWRKNIAQDLDLTFGASGGVGIVFGSLTRWEAAWSGGATVASPGDPYTQLSRCAGAGNPDALQCPANGNYGSGEAWPVYPWLSGQIGLRYQPDPHFIGRFDLGISSSGFVLGVGADYGL